MTLPMLGTTRPSGIRGSRMATSKASSRTGEALMVVPPAAFTCESSESFRKRLHAASTREIWWFHRPDGGFGVGTRIGDHDHRGRAQRRETDRISDIGHRHEDPA